MDTIRCKLRPQKCRTMRVLDVETSIKMCVCVCVCRKKKDIKYHINVLSVRIFNPIVCERLSSKCNVELDLLSLDASTRRRWMCCSGSNIATTTSAVRRTPVPKVICAARCQNKVWSWSHKLYDQNLVCLDDKRDRKGMAPEKGKNCRTETRTTKKNQIND